jgi:hypothetical protein
MTEGSNSPGKPKMTEKRSMRKVPSFCFFPWRISLTYHKASTPRLISARPRLTIHKRYFRAASTENNGIAEMSQADAIMRGMEQEFFVFLYSGLIFLV